MALFWLSFCDPAKPPGSQFLGVTIVGAESITDAIDITWEEEVNPGGQVRGVMLSDAAANKIPKEYRLRLLTWDECTKLEKSLVTWH